MNNVVKNFDILATGLSALHNYFDRSTKLLFCDLYPAKILNLSKQNLFFCVNIRFKENFFLQKN